MFLFSDLLMCCAFELLCLLSQANLLQNIPKKIKESKIINKMETKNTASSKLEVLEWIQRQIYLELFSFFPWEVKFP